MSQFKPLELSQVEGQAHSLLVNMKKKSGMVPNVYAVMAHSPTTLSATLAFSSELEKSTLSAIVCEKIALVVSNENGCTYCVSTHSAIAASLGLGDDEILEAQKGKSEHAVEQAILTLAISVNSNHGHGDNSAVRKALEVGLSSEQIIDVIGQVVKNIMTNSLNGIAETALDYPARPLI